MPTAKDGAATGYQGFTCFSKMDHIAGWGDHEPHQPGVRAMSQLQSICVLVSCYLSLVSGMRIYIAFTSEEGGLIDYMEAIASIVIVSILLGQLGLLR